jgi:hypothetical protein
MVLYLAQFDPVQIDTGSAGSAVSLVDDYSLSFLLGKNLGGAAINEAICVFLMIEVIGDLDAGHQAVETS